jgi:hypothetical protein
MALVGSSEMLRSSPYYKVAMFLKAAALISSIICTHVRKFEKSDYKLRLSASNNSSPTARIFLWNLIFEYFSKMCRENSNLR